MQGDPNPPHLHSAISRVRLLPVLFKVFSGYTCLYLVPLSNQDWVARCPVP